MILFYFYFNYLLFFFILLYMYDNIENRKIIEIEFFIKIVKYDLRLIISGIEKVLIFFKIF